MALKSGWEFAPGANEADPNALIRNTQTGQMVTVSNPVYTNYKDPNAQQTIDNGPVGAPVSGPITTQQQVANTTSNVGQQTPQGQPTTIAQSFQQGLVNRLNPQPVSVDDPSIAPAIQANKLAEQRNMENQRNILAEQAAKGGYGGNFETGLKGLAEDRAAREGQFAGAAVQHASDLQNQNMTSALGMGAGLLSGIAGNDLQKYLGDLDAQIRREALAQQGALGESDIALRGRLGEAGINEQLLGTLLQNQQFGQNLGFNYANLDQQGLSGLLGLLK